MTAREIALGMTAREIALGMTTRDIALGMTALDIALGMTALERMTTTSMDINHNLFAAASGKILDMNATSG
jgi:hypothetical protein